MRKRSGKILALLSFTIGLAVANRAAAQDNATKADDKKVILEVTVIDDQVIDERGKLVAGATVSGIYTGFDSRPTLKSGITTSADGRFHVPREALPLLLLARAPDGRQMGLARVDPEQKEVTIRVGPMAAANGRLVDQTGKPAMLGYIRYAIRIPRNENNHGFQMFGGGEAILDSEGRFTLTGLIPGENFELHYTSDGETSTIIGICNASAGTMLQLGTLKYTADPRRPERTRIEIGNTQELFNRQEQLSHRLHEMLTGTSYDFIVQRGAGTNESTIMLPEELAGMLLGISQVNAIPPGLIDYTLLDFVDLDGKKATGVLVNGWWPARCPLFTRFKFQPDGRPLKVGDKNTAVIGKDLVRKLGKKIGDTISIKGPQKFKIVGIYESPLEFENNAMVVPVQDLRAVLGLMREVTAFAVSAERPIDENGLEELRQRIEAIQPGLEVTRVERQMSDAVPPTKSK
jgi:hypothetical protein